MNHRKIYRIINFCAVATIVIGCLVVFGISCHSDHHTDEKKPHTYGTLNADRPRIDYHEYELKTLEDSIHFYEDGY